MTIANPASETAGMISSARPAPTAAKRSLRPCDIELLLCPRRLGRRKYTRPRGQEQGRAEPRPGGGAPRLPRQAGEPPPAAPPPRPDDGARDRGTHESGSERESERARAPPGRRRHG